MPFESEVEMREHEENSHIKNICTFEGKNLWIRGLLKKLCLLTLKTFKNPLKCFFHLPLLSNDQKHCSKLNFKPAEGQLLLDLPCQPIWLKFRPKKSTCPLISSPFIHKFLLKAVEKSSNSSRFYGNIGKHIIRLTVIGWPIRIRIWPLISFLSVLIVAKGKQFLH